MASKAIPIDLGDMAESAERLQRLWEYDSLSEVVQEGLRALDREQRAFDEMCRIKVQQALDDPRPSIPAEDAYRELDRRAQVRRAQAHAAE